MTACLGRLAIPLDVPRSVLLLLNSHSQCYNWDMMHYIALSWSCILLHASTDVEFGPVIPGIVSNNQIEREWREGRCGEKGLLQ